MKTEPYMNPAEQLCLLAEACYFDEMIQLIETCCVKGTEAPASKIGEIYITDIEQALLKIPPHKFDTAIVLIQLLLTYNLDKSKITYALHRAVSKSQIRTVRLLLDHGAYPNPQSFGQHDYSNHLDEAAAVGDIDAIDTLIAAGADINLATKAVCLAAQNGRTKTLQLLIDMGFPFDPRSLGYYTLISNNPSTLDAVRKAGVVFTTEHMQDEDVMACPKSLEYLVKLNLQPIQGQVD